jgi:succinylglutamate desuccinylase
MVECLDHFVGEHPHLERFDHFPVALFDVPASGIRRHLAGPSLFHLPGRAAAPLFVSVLLHGNEDTGWQAVQTVLQHHRGKLLPRPLFLFVGNVEVAKANVRTLPTQSDYNRTWPGTPLTSAREAKLMREVLRS